MAMGISGHATGALSEPRTVTARVEGCTYQIPDMWLAGMARRHGLWQAIVHWHRQAQLERAFNRQLAAQREAVKEVCPDD